jgi:CRP/FNR family transcriptional regulator, cyclic AMP receptor protein
VVPTLGRQTAVDRLKMIDQFASCTREQLQYVVRLAERVRVGQGEILTREDRIGREFFLILSGTVGVTQKGRRVSTLGPGDFFGEVAALSPRLRDATVTALSDLDVLIIGPRELGAMTAIPGFRDALLKGLARRLCAADARLKGVPDGDPHPDRVR